jgi:hypothetical protein
MLSPRVGERVPLATGSAVIRAWAESPTPITAAQADNAARVLQLAGLVPISGKGGGKAAAHWGSRALVDHMLALLLADPATAAPSEVRTFRTLPFKGRLINALEADIDGKLTGRMVSTELLAGQHDSSSRPVTPFPGADFGDVVGRLLSDLATRGAIEVPVWPGRPMSFAALVENGFRLVFRVWPRKIAFIELRLPDGSSVSYMFDSAAPELAGVTDGRDDSSTNWLDRVTTVHVTALQMLADLLRDTLARQAAISPVGSSPTPENENADPSPKGPAPSVRSRHKGVATPSHGPGSLSSAESMPRACACATSGLASGPPASQATRSAHDERHRTAVA